MSNFISLEECLSLDFAAFDRLSKALCRINPSQLEDELVKHATVYSYYHGILVRIKSILDKHLNDFEIFCSKVSNEELLSSKKSSFKATAKYLEDFVRSHPDYQKMREEVLALEEVYGYTKSLCVGLEHKKDMIVQLSANKRSETKLYS